MKDIILLGSTGSVGKNVLDVVRRYPGKFRLKAVSSNENIGSLVDQIEEFSPDFAAIGNEKLYPEIKKKATKNTRIVAGPKSLEELASDESADIIFMAISGTAALRPLIAALEAGKTVALASKEPVVSAGMIIKKLMDKGSSRILPVDSEHSAIAQCLNGRGPEDVNTLYITGSGGSLDNVDMDEFDSLSVDRVLDHPKWSMGPKITVDSATLMNKGLEVIEARWLFDIPPEKIKVIIHPQAVVHSMVEFVDGIINAVLFCPDMRFPILKALMYPDIVANDFPKVDFNVVNDLSFREPDTDKFPALEMAFEALRAGGTLPAVINSANEASVRLFLDGKIKFTEITKIVRDVMNRHGRVDDPTLDEIINSEEWAREEVLRSC